MAGNQGERCPFLFLEVKISSACAAASGGDAEGTCRKTILLERKRTLRQVDIRETPEDKILVYEHAKTGEAFIIQDPRLRLDQLDSVQQEIYSLLGKV
jgi:hypothetical protein